MSVIIGLNHSNDAAAAQIVDGRVVRASAEERFSRTKHDANFPQNALSWLLEDGKTSLDAAEAVAFFWNPARHMDAPNARLTRSPRSHLEYLYSLPNQLFGRDPALSTLPFMELRLPFARGSQRLVFVTHHLCHAAHAFYESPFSRAAILTVDGYGERSSTLIARGHENRIEPLLEVPFPHSLGSVYAAFTEYLGFRANNGEGKVMGLASYGEPVYAELMQTLLRTTNRGFEVDLTFFDYYHDRAHRYADRLVEALGEPRKAGAPLEKRHQDIAASLQERVEEVLLHLSKLAGQLSGENVALCMAGGVALNCVANGRIAAESGFERCFFQPACHDAGTSAGAALYVAHDVLGQKREIDANKTDYLGPRFSVDELRRAVEFSGLSYHEPADPAEHVATSLAAEKIVARFDGRAEFGPRALGNRSILAPPGPAAFKDTLNARVKRRESFRPFAPSVLAERCGEYFDSDVPSPFMLRAYNTKPQYIERLGAITHVDGTARVQTITAAQNQPYTDLIAAYGKKSGIDCVLNTSFNVRGEPIVNTPEQAIRCFASTGIDELLLGPFVVRK
jgi:carbamoyltransferase